MLARLFATLVKIAVASLIVGTVLAHFGITADQILKDMGVTPERLAELARQAFAWALPNVLLERDELSLNRFWIPKSGSF